jgi:hypothetical protein
MPNCVYHPQVDTNEFCAACTLPHCSACLVDFAGQRLCGRCRDLRLAQMQGLGAQADRPPTFADQVIPARNPKALIGYYLGVFSLIPCLALLLGPAALILGILGVKARKENPNLPGQAHAITAIVLGSLTSLVNWGFLIFGLVMAGMSR